MDCSVSSYICVSSESPQEFISVASGDIVDCAPDLYSAITPQTWTCIDTATSSAVVISEPLSIDIASDSAFALGVRDFSGLFMIFAFLLIFASGFSIGTYIFKNR